jgi:hypothetical protein
MQPTLSHPPTLRSILLSFFYLQLLIQSSFLSLRFPDFPAGAGNFSLHHRVQNGSGAHPASYPMGTGGGALSLGVKRPGREADHSPPSSSDVKNAWSYTSTPQYCFMAWCLVKHRDNFTFTFNFISYLLSLLSPCTHLSTLFETKKKNLKIFNSRYFIEPG